jgi:hypothetical protein
MTLALRDELEAVLRGWDAYEKRRGGLPVIDFDFRPDLTEQLPVHAAWRPCPAAPTSSLVRRQPKTATSPAGHRPIPPTFVPCSENVSH